MTNIEQKLVASAAGPLASSYPPDISAALEHSGHADVVYMVEDSPVGRLLLAASDRGLVCLHFVPDDAGLERSLDAIAAKLTPRVVAGKRRLELPRRELDEFFAGRLHTFEMPLDWSLVKPGFTSAVLKATARIPFGETTSYKGIAGRAGNERAFRAAGTALGSNPLPIVVPCHRVLHSGGGLGGYTGGLEVKRALLTLEGHAT
ncbi:MAG TPA: methylated-DNA--[protein]-cysteine S-methyltransferase [Solirubrobacteraceae bacterium]|nr:methylated-DNA--[protein]-cysteine S-methyltransferase [Solirubrobacteraceae bacterium]